MTKFLRIGTRDSQLAVWQSHLVQSLLKENGIASALVFIKSEGDVNLTTPLYEMGVQGIFTKALDIALLENRIDIAVHSMKDVPVVLARGLQQAAVLKRASWQDLLVYKGDADFLMRDAPAVIATSSIRRIAQWKHRYPNHSMVSLRGNVNTRLRKLEESEWQGAIFAAAGLERIGLRPDSSLNLDWMLPAPAQGAIMVACRSTDRSVQEMLHPINDPETALCTLIERSFLRTLQGGCSSPVSALAIVKDGLVSFTGNLASHDGKYLETVTRTAREDAAANIGADAALELLSSDNSWIKMALNP